MKNLVFAVVAITSMAGGLAEAAANYIVKAELRRDGEVIGTPTMIVEAGKRGVAEVTADNGLASYRLEAELEALDDEQIQVMTQLTTADGGMEPVMTVTLGETAKVSSDGLTMTLTVGEASGFGQ